MHVTRLLTAAVAVALAAGAAQAQIAPVARAPAAPATTAPPAASAAPKVVANGDIIQTTTLSGQFKTFLKAVDATNLTSVLKTNKNLTVFVPTDAAFAALPPGELDRLMLPENKTQLQKLLTYHIINARVDSTRIKGAKGAVPTVAGASVELDGSGAMLMVNNADIIQPDVMATNGVLHVIDKVLTPATASASAATGGSSAASTTAPATPAIPAKPAAPTPK